MVGSYTNEVRVNFGASDPKMRRGGGDDSADPDLTGSAPLSPLTVKGAVRGGFLAFRLLLWGRDEG